MGGMSCRLRFMTLRRIGGGRFWLSRWGVCVVLLMAGVGGNEPCGNNSL
jgi:hypothetical protein